MYFDTKNGHVYEPDNRVLLSFYETLKKLAPTLNGSPVFDDLVDVYETLDFDLKEDKK